VVDPYNTSINEMLRRPLEITLRPLVGVEDLRPAKFREGLLECRDAKVRRQRVREPERQHLAAGDVEDFLRWSPEYQAERSEA